MRPPVFRGSFDPRELVVDNFAGGGGASRGETASKEQAAALVRFARRHGRFWKVKLRACWEFARYELFVEMEADFAVLQGVRNQLGPSWLARTTTEELRLLAEAGRFALKVIARF